MKTHSLAIIFLSFTSIGFSQTIFGFWNSFDEETNRVESVIEIYEKEALVFAKVNRITDAEKQGATCSMCNGERKNKVILGMDILTGLKRDGNQWSGGKILDPKNGKEYTCYVKLLDQNTLKIRGYIGHAAFGRTVIWKRTEK